MAVELLKREFSPFDEGTITRSDCLKAIAVVVTFYGGNMKDTRHRLDNLMKYGKNELDGPER